MSDQVYGAAPESVCTTPRTKIRTHHLAKWKAEGHKWAMLTAYDYSSARIFDDAEIPVLLVGDSGEADPEIYAELARTHPAQIVGIRIRDVSDEDASAPRYRATFEGLPAALWQVYTDPQTLRAP